MKFKRLLRKITNYGQIGRYSMTSLRACPIKIIFITIFHGLRLKNIFLRALTWPWERCFLFASFVSCIFLLRFCDKLHFPDARASEMLDDVLRRCDQRQIAVFAGVGENKEAVIIRRCMGF